MTSDSGNPSCASRYSVSSAVGGQKISHIQFVLRKPFQVLVGKKNKPQTLIRLCKTSLLAGVIRLFMSDDACWKYRPSFFSEELLFFAEEFVIWKQRLRKNSQPVSQGACWYQLSPVCPQCQEVTSITRGSGCLSRLCSARQCRASSWTWGVIACLWECVTSSYLPTDPNIALLLHTARYLTLYIRVLLIN